MPYFWATTDPINGELFPSAMNPQEMPCILIDVAQLYTAAISEHKHPPAAAEDERAAAPRLWRHLLALT